MTAIDPVATLRRVLAGEDLSSADVEALLGAVMDGALSPVHQAALLVALAASAADRGSFINYEGNISGCLCFSNPRKSVAVC